MGMDQGKTVEYIDQGRFMCTLCLEDRNGKLHVLTTNNREINLSSKRVLLVSDRVLADVSLARDELLARLREAEARRDTLKEQVRVGELWELIHDENESFDYEYLSELAFGPPVDDDHISALVRALFEDKIHFKLKDGRFQPNTRQRIEEILHQREEERQREQVLREGSEWLRMSLDGKSPPLPESAREVLKLLTDLALYEGDAPDYKQARELLSRAGCSERQSARRLMVILGLWEEDENLDLLRFKTHTEFSEDLIESSENLRHPDIRGLPVEDLRGLNVFTIDGAFTRDYDDALSLEHKDGVFEVGIHIADVAGVVPEDSPLDLEARYRGASMYLPRRQIPMLPPSLSQDTLSLKKGCDRPAVSLLCRLGSEGELLGYRFTPSIIQVKQQLTYEEGNGRIGQDGLFSEMHRLATAFQQKRVESGALVLSFPEVSIRVDEDGTVSLRAFDQDTPARMLVAEFMILYNWLAAVFCREQRIPILYRGQAEASERLNRGDMDHLFFVFMQRRKLQPMMVSTEPAQHAGLGLDAYTNVSSPIRRYMDLVVQRQIRSRLLGSPLPYDEEALEGIRMTVQSSLKDMAMVRRNRTRYWVLKYLRQNRGQPLNALVLWSTRSRHRLLLTDVLLVAEIKRKNGRDFEPGQYIRVSVEKSNPWGDELVLGLAEEPACPR